MRRLLLLLSLIAVASWDEDKVERQGCQSPARP